MSQRTDQKLQEVVVGRYAYRHEAEFAAGFLRDAGIPHRLQIDDPSLGIMLSTSAVLWVLAMDERRAREALEDTPAAPNAGSAPASAPHRVARVVPERRSSPQVGPHRSASDELLAGRARLLAVVGGVGLLALGVTSPPGALAAAGLAGGSGLMIVALVGRAPATIRRLLSALGGEVR